MRHGRRSELTEDADIERRGSNPPEGREGARGGRPSGRETSDPDVLGLVADVERMLGRLAREVDDPRDSSREDPRDDPRAADRARTALEDERARLLERQIALESQVASLRAAEAERDAAREALMRAAHRLTDLANLADAQEKRIAELETERKIGLNTERKAERKAELETDVEARVREVLAVRVEQLADVARFLKTRRERLAALRRGLRMRARSQRVLRQVYADAIDPNVEAPPVAETRECDGIANPAAASAVADREARILALDEPMAAHEPDAFDEGPPLRRAGPFDLAARAAVIATGLALVATVSWFVAGAIVPERVVGSVEIEVARRDPAPVSTTPSADGTTRAPKREIDAAPVAGWIRGRLADADFAGAVAVRLADRGKSDAEAGALVEDLASRASIDVANDRIALALPGEGAEPTAALLDAVATTAVFEANRDPARRTDGLRLEVANARREVGRTVFAHVEPVADEGRPVRAAIVAGALLSLAALATAGLRALARRDAEDGFARA